MALKYSNKQIHFICYYMNIFITFKHICTWEFITLSPLNHTIFVYPLSESCQGNWAQNRAAAEHEE